MGGNKQKDAHYKMPKIIIGLKFKPFKIREAKKHLYQNLPILQTNSEKETFYYFCQNLSDRTRNCNLLWDKLQTPSRFYVFPYPLLQVVKYVQYMRYVFDSFLFLADLNFFKKNTKFYPKDRRVNLNITLRSSKIF